MRILIGGFGSRGDMQPMLALGLGLRARGHEVTVCGPPDFAALADELALPFAAVGGSVQAVVERGTQPLRQRPARDGASRGPDDGARTLCGDGTAGGPAATSS